MDLFGERTGRIENPWWFVEFGTNSTGQRRQNARLSPNVLGKKDSGMERITGKCTQSGHLLKRLLQFGRPRSKWIRWYVCTSLIHKSIQFLEFISYSNHINIRTNRLHVVNRWNTWSRVGRTWNFWKNSLHELCWLQKKVRRQRFRRTLWR